MLLSNGKDTVNLTNEIQIRAYKSSGYAECGTTEDAAEEPKKPIRRKKED